MRATSPSDRSIVRRPDDVVAAASRYDLVLAVIPFALATGALFGASPVVPDHLGVGGGGVVALAATVYALFGDPPIRGRHEPPRSGYFRRAD